MPSTFPLTIDACAVVWCFHSLVADPVLLVAILLRPPVYVASSLFEGAPMGRFGHAWREAFLSALNETDTKKLPGRVEYAITALERRYAEWGGDPGTQAELNAIHRAISALERRLMNEKLVQSENVLPRNSGGILEEAHHGQLGHIRHLFLILRS